MLTIYQELYSTKNSRRFVRTKTGKPLLLKSPQAEKSMVSLMKELNIPKNRSEWFSMILFRKPPFQVSFKIYRKTKRDFDLVNIIQGLLDCMVKVGYIEDDNANYIIPVFKNYEVDPKSPRVEIDVLTTSQ